MHAVVTREGTIAVEDVDEPVPGPGQVLVAPLACGICGSDVHLVETQKAMPQYVPPIVLGHEFVAEVLDYGPDTAGRFAPGTIVTSVPYLDAADGPQLIGLSPTAVGGLAERMLLQERRLIEVPPGVNPHHAALTEPLAVGAHAVAAARLHDGDVPLVIGCGPVGLAVIAALKAAGHGVRGPVVAADFSAERRALAEAIGADIVVDPSETSPYAAWSELLGPELPPSPLWEAQLRPDTVIFECVGVPGVLNTVMESAPPHSRIVVVGVCQTPDKITPAVGIVKELALQFVFAYRPDEFAQALRWLADGTVDVTPLITATLPLSEAARAFGELAPPSAHGKILLLPTES